MALQRAVCGAQAAFEVDLPGSSFERFRFPIHPRPCMLTAHDSYSTQMASFQARALHIRSTNTWRWCMFQEGLRSTTSKELCALA